MTKCFKLEEKKHTNSFWVLDIVLNILFRMRFGCQKAGRTFLCKLYEINDKRHISYKSFCKVPEFEAALLSGYLRTCLFTYGLTYDLLRDIVVLVYSCAV